MSRGTPTDGFSQARVLRPSMRIRGDRECRDCGSRWSYYETGSVDCPDCGSIRSRGLDEERVAHTAGTATLDLSEIRAAVDDRPAWELAADAKAACREYVRQDGFLHGGELQRLDDTHLAARELIHVADLTDRSIDLADEQELYLVTLLGGADRGERPAPDEVPGSLREARGLAAAEAVQAYRRELRDWLDDHPHPEVEAPLARLDQHVKRVVALQGAVPPAAAERLVEATRDLATAVRRDDETALASAADRLDRLESIQED